MLLSEINFKKKLKINIITFYYVTIPSFITKLYYNPILLTCILAFYSFYSVWIYEFGAICTLNFFKSNLSVTSYWIFCSYLILSISNLLLKKKN